MSKSQIDSLIQQRSLLVEELLTIDRMRRGTLSEQFFKSSSGGPKRGPYYVLQGFLQGRKFSRRIPADQASEVREHVENYRRFQTLAGQYVSLSDEITCLESAGGECKKNSSPRRSTKRGSAKQKPS